MQARLPDWLVYATIVAALALAARGRQERADAPTAPPPVPGMAETPIAPTSPFAADRTAPVAPKTEAGAGTAFSVGDQGLWLTAAHVIDGCAQVGVVVAEGRGVEARLAARRGDLAVLKTEGGAPALPIAPAAATLRTGEQVFHPGFPGGAPGEAASRLLGRQALRAHRRGGETAEVDAFAENGRTDGLRGSLAGLSGAPVLDERGQVVGVTLGQSPRRGRLYAATPEAVRALLAAAHAPAPDVVAQPLSVETYGRVADTLRRDLRVVQVVCLA